MALSKAQQLARLAAGKIYNLAKEFVQQHSGKFSGFWTSIKAKFGLTTQEATRLAVEGREAVRAAVGLGSDQVPFDEGNAASAPLNPRMGPGPEPTDRLQYHVRLRYRRGSDGTIQNRVVNVFSDLPLTNQDLESAAQSELVQSTLLKQGSETFIRSRDELLDWSVDWAVSFRPLP